LAIKSKLEVITAQSNQITLPQCRPMACQLSLAA